MVVRLKTLKTMGFGTPGYISVCVFFLTSRQSVETFGHFCLHWFNSLASFASVTEQIHFLC